MVAVSRGTARIGQICPVSHPGAPCILSPQLHRCHFHYAGHECGEAVADEADKREDGWAAERGSGRWRGRGRPATHSGREGGRGQAHGHPSGNTGNLAKVPSGFCAMLRIRIWIRI